MFYKKLTAFLTAVAITASAVLSGTPANIAFAEAGAWSQDGDAYSYTAITDDDANQATCPLTVSTNDDWSDIKYLAADVTVQGTASPVLGANLPGDVWVDSGWTSVTDTTATIYLATEGQEISNPTLMLWSIKAGTTVTISNTRFLTETPAGVWVEESEGVWTYTHGSNSSANVPVLNISKCFENTDWTGINSVSLEVTVEGKAKPALCGNIDSKWSSSDKYLENDSALLYLSTKGKTYDSAQVQFWGFGDNNICAEAGTKITVSAVKASAEIITPPAGTWYEESDGVWKYTHGDVSTTAVPGLYLGNYFENTDWVATNNVTLEITVEGKARPALMAKVGGKDVFNDNNFRTTSTADGTRVVYIYTGGAQASDFYLGFWDYDGGNYAEAGTKITVSNIKASADEETYRLIQGELIEYKPNCFYFKFPTSNYYWIGSFSNPECDISEVQSFSFDVTSSNNTALQVLADTAETVADPNVRYETAVSASSTKRYTKRSVYGKLTGTPGFGASASAGTEIRIENFTYHTEPAEPGIIEPNGLLIHSDSTDVFEMYENDNGELVADGSVVISKSEMQMIDVPGVIQIYAEPIDPSKSSFCQFAINYSDGRTNFEDGDKNYTGAGWLPLPMGAPVYNIPITPDGIIEVEITEELVKDLDKLVMEGTNFRYEKAVFVPTPDSEKPAASDEVTDTEKDKIGNCEFKYEKHAPKKGSEFRDGKPEAHKSEIKTNHKGERYYAQRIVQRVKKSELDGAKSVTIVAFAKNKNKYIKLELKEYYVDLNMNGSKVEAEGDYAFLTVIFDNIPENEELTFTEFTINK